MRRRLQTMLSGWADTWDAAEAALHDGEVQLAAAQDHGIVTPLAFVVGPDTVCLEASDLAAPERSVVAPLNDGPPPHALRFGGQFDDGLSIARLLNAEIGPDLAKALKPPQPMLGLMAQSLSDGDELHGRVSAMQGRVLELFDCDSVSTATANYLATTGQFALNAVMAASALMIGAGAGVANSTMVTACGGNGQALGYKLASAPEVWRTVSGPRPIGPRLPGQDAAIPLPAIGDSAVIDALGFGAACLRFCPELSEALQGHFDRGELSRSFLDVRAHLAFVGPHPAFAHDGVHLGLDLARPRDCLGIMLGMVEETGRHGLIGRGIAPWPVS